MTSCDELSDRMPDVAGAHSRWSGEEAHHLATCEACQLEWHIVRGATRLGKSPLRLDKTALTKRVLRELHTGTAPATRKAALFRSHYTSVRSRDTDRLSHKLWRMRMAGTPWVWLPAASAVLLLALGGAVMWRGVTRQRTPAVSDRPQMVELVARPGHRATFPLPDGSWIVLAAGSRLRYVLPLTTGPRRDVYLDGEAYFAVAHDSTRPFRVHAGHAVTRVLGTHFSVRAYADEDTVRVVVAEGKVSLGRDGVRETVLARGDLGTLRRGEIGGSVSVRHQVDVARYLAWAAEAVFADAQAGQVVLGPFAMDTLTQEHRMRLWSRSVAGLMLALPAPALAQTVTPADLVGTWVETSVEWSGSNPSAAVDRLSRGVPANKPFVREVIWTIRADSTITQSMRVNGVADTNNVQLHWELQGNTVQLNGPWGSGSWKVARRGEQLSWDLERSKNPNTCFTMRMHRVDASKPLPPPSVPSASKPAALVGTWVLTSIDSFAVQIIDSLELRADSTWRYIASGQSVTSAARTGDGWFLLPGDDFQTLMFWSGGSPISQNFVRLQGDRLLLGTCGDKPAYKRVAP